MKIPNKKIVLKAMSIVLMITLKFLDRYQDD